MVPFRSRRRSVMTLSISSTAFADGQRIPRPYTRDGGNVSPPLQWSGAPAKTRSFAVIVEDPDAPRGTFRHWAAYDIPPDQHGLEEDSGAALPATPGMRGTFRMVTNDFGATRYDGPQPPPGHGTHHYHFRLFALDVPS